MSSTHVQPEPTAPCWVPSTVSNRACSASASATPDAYGVAGSPVVDTTSTVGRPSACGTCRLLVGGAGHSAHTPSAPTTGVPGSVKGAPASTLLVRAAVA